MFTKSDVSDSEIVSFFQAATMPKHRVKQKDGEIAEGRAISLHYQKVDR